GGGYELALACDEIILVDDGSTAVSMPEVPLLAVLPGTGGLTRLVDKRGVRKDLADVVATRSEGVRGRTAQAWRLVDQVPATRRRPTQAACNPWARRSGRWRCAGNSTTSSSGCVPTRWSWAPGRSRPAGTPPRWPATSASSRPLPVRTGWRARSGTSSSGP